MATADANVLAGATNSASNGQDTESESAESEGNIGEQLEEKLLREGDSEELAIERTADEL
jgi:hypothetical protein